MATFRSVGEGIVGQAPTVTAELILRFQPVNTSYRPAVAVPTGKQVMRLSDRVPDCVAGTVRGPAWVMVRDWAVGAVVWLWICRVAAVVPPVTRYEVWL